MDISRIDKNFSAQTADENGFVFCNVKDAPFVLEGLPWYEANDRDYCRLPKTFTTREVSEGVLFLSRFTAGVCVRFRSDSPELMIRSVTVDGCDCGHMTRACSMGFDSYYRKGGKYLYNKTIMPQPGQDKICALIGVNPERKMFDWIINFPLFGGVRSVEIGLKSGSRLAPARPHKISRPILFYGSSITEGGCASRPGNAYTSMLCRALDAEQINLGFSGSGKGEIAIAEAIASLELSAFVFDYDHNAATIEHLEATHEPFFQAVRKVRPELPVIIMSKCDFPYIAPEAIEVNRRRRDIIRRTWQNAVDAGDKNVYWIDGETLFGTDFRDGCTVDGCHPNDLGFYRMYRKVLPVLKKARAGR